MGLNIYWNKKYNMLELGKKIKQNKGKIKKCKKVKI